MLCKFQTSNNGMLATQSLEVTVTVIPPPCYLSPTSRALGFLAECHSSARKCHTLWPGKCCCKTGSFLPGTTQGSQQVATTKGTMIQCFCWFFATSILSQSFYFILVKKKKRGGLTFLLVLLQNGEIFHNTCLSLTATNGEMRNAGF